MDDERKLQQAQKAYETCIKMFDNRNWHYRKDDEKLHIECKVSGDDLPMDIDFYVIPNAMVIQLLSQLPFQAKEEKRVDMAVATQMVNWKLVNGSFDFSMESGSTVFRLTSSYRDSLISEELMSYMLDVSAITIDDYNEKFFAVATGMMDLDAFNKEINKED